MTPAHAEWRPLLLFVSALTFLFAALTADGQTTDRAACLRAAGLPLSAAEYQGRQLTGAERAALRAIGPVTVDTSGKFGSRPPDGPLSFPTVLDFWTWYSVRPYGLPGAGAYGVEGGPQVPHNPFVRATGYVRWALFGDAAPVSAQHGQTDWPCVYPGETWTVAQRYFASYNHDGNADGVWSHDGRLGRSCDCLRGQIDPEPSPVPVPVPPVPEPPPTPPPPSCVQFAGSSCEARCVQVRKDRAWCLDPAREIGARHLFGLCAEICRGGEPEPPLPPPPPPPPEPPVEPPGPLPPECYSGSRVVVSVLSTGRLQVVLYNPGTGECEVSP